MRFTLHRLTRGLGFIVFIILASFAIAPVQSAPPTKITYAIGDQLISVNPDGSFPKAIYELVISDEVIIYDVEYDYINDRYFFALFVRDDITDDVTAFITVVNAAGTNFTNIITKSGVFFTGLHLDLENNHLYYTENPLSFANGTGQIMRANLNGSSSQPIFTATDTTYVFDVAVSDRLYMTTLLMNNGNPDATLIASANLNGRGFTPLINADDNAAMAGVFLYLALDADRNRIFFGSTEGGLHAINTNGGNFTSYTTGTNGVTGVDIIPESRTIYYLTSSNTLGRIQYNDSGNTTLKTNGGSATGNVTTNAIPNEPPVAQNDNYSVTVGEALRVSAPGVLNNDSDPDNDSLNAQLRRDVTKGRLTFNVDGSFNYTPNRYATGNDTFTYVAGDGDAASAPATVTIRLQDPAGDPPRLLPFDGAVVNTSNYRPHFRFRHKDGVEWYNVWIGSTNGEQALYAWYPATDQSTGAQAGQGICNLNNGVCTIPDEVYVTNGDYQWWMTYWGPNDPDTDSYWNDTTFTVNVAAPETVNRRAPTTPYEQITWERDPKALWYHLWTGTVKPTSTVDYGWYEADEICTDTLCTLPLDDAITSGDYQWWMEAWGPGGYTTWTDNGQFDYTVP